MSRVLRLAGLLSIVLWLHSQLAAQSSYATDIGLPVYSTTLPAELGVVNVSNGNIHIDIPLTDGQERGKLSSKVHLIYDSKLWNISFISGGYKWQPVNVLASGFNPQLATSGWRFQTGTSNLPTSYTTTSPDCNFTRSSFHFADSDGTVHAFPFSTVQWFSSCPSSHQDVITASGFATDGSGYQATVSNYQYLTVFDKNGNEVYPNAIDTNGNFETYDHISGNLKDTRGDTVAAFSQISNNVQTLGTPAPDNGPSGYTITYQSINVSTNFQQSAVGEFSGTLYVINSLKAADGSTYTFNYDSGTTPGHYGELISVTLPTGGTVQYAYSNFGDSYGNINRWLTSKAANGGTTIYSPTVLSKCTSNGSATDTGCQEEVTVELPIGHDVVYTQTINNGAWTTKTDQYTGGRHTGTLISSTTSQDTFTQYSNVPGCPVSTPSSCTFRASNTATTTYSATGQQTKTITTFAAADFPQPWFGDTAKIAVYDFATGSQSSLPLAQTEYNYAYIGSNNSPYGSHYISDVYVEGGNGTPVTQSHYNYDAYPLTSTSNLPQHQLSGKQGGNLSSVTSAGGATLFHYDDAGALLSVVDPLGHTTSYGYDPSDSLVTTTTRPSTNGVSHVATAMYNSVYRSLRQTNDENSVAQGSTHPTNYTYYSGSSNGYNTGKIQSIATPDGGLSTFSQSTPTTSSQVILQSSSTSTSMSRSAVLDGYGRPSSTSAGAISTSATWDAIGRSLCTSAPYNPSSPSPTDGQECVTSRDGLDRPLVVTHPDGTSLSYVYSGNRVVVTDELNHQKAYVFDALGRLTQVWEPDANGSLTWETDYSYTPNGQIQSAVQKGGTADSSQWRSRIWTYDANGRLAQEQTPEAGTVCYGLISNGSCTSDYDANGNLRHLSDGSGVTTIGYDELNRVTSRSAVQGNVTVSQGFTYDVAPQGSGFNAINGVGSLTASTDSSIGMHYYQYDVVGRLTYQANCLSNPCHPTDNVIRAVYDQAGNITALTYPDGRTITNTLDGNSRPIKVQYTSWNGQAQSPVTYWSNASYFPPGQVQSATIGANIQLAESYSNRQVLTSLGYFVGGSPLWQKQYAWDKNALNLTQIADVPSGVKRNLAYDPVNRLASVVDYSGGALLSGGMSEAYTLDPWGNLKSSRYSPLGFNQHNQLSDGTPYTAAGNLVSDQINDSYTYDPLGRLRTGTSAAGFASFSYDANNLRVRKDGWTSSVGYFYFGSQLIATYTSTNSSYTDYIYAGTAIIAEVPGNPTGTATFRLSDHLGSQVVSTDSSGSVLGKADYYPYGQVFSSTLPSRFQFTGLERTSETNASSAMFRELMNPQSRWLTPDPYRGSYRWTDPQSLNRYAYVADKPLSLTDPLGLDSEGFFDFFADLFFPENEGGGTPKRADIHVRPDLLANLGEILTCASEFASKYSIEGGLHALGVPKDGVGGYLANAIGGNVFSGITDLGAHVITNIKVGGNGSEVLKDVATGGVSQGLPIGDAAVFKGVGGLATDAVFKSIHAAIFSSGSELGFLFGKASLIGTSGAEFASGVGEIKVVVDLGVYTAGLIKCSAGKR